MTEDQIEKIKRVSQIRKELGIKQADFAKILDINRTNLSSIESFRENRLLPNGTSYILEKELNVNPIWLETGEGDKFLGDVPRGKYGNAKDLGQIEYDPEINSKFVDLGDGKYLMVVPLVNEFAHAGYLSNFKDSEYLEDLPKHTIIVDKHHRGHYRAFEVVGDSMDNDSRESITDGSIATGREIKREHWRSKFHTHRSKDFIFVSKTEGIICKRIIGQDIDQGVLTLHSLNPDKYLYPDFQLALDDTQQIFSIVQVTQKRYI